MGKPKIARRDTGARHNRKTRILLLETQLPARLSSSSRRQIVFMQELLRPSSNLELIGDRVHSRSDLKKFLDLARRDPRIRVVHIVSHGEYRPKRPTIILTGDERINLAAPEGLNLFRGLSVPSTGTVP